MAKLTKQELLERFGKIDQCLELSEMCKEWFEEHERKWYSLFTWPLVLYFWGRVLNRANMHFRKLPKL